MSNRFLRNACLWTLCLFFLAGSVIPANAQVLYGSAVGLIEDPSGSVIPNAKVVLTNKGTGQQYETTADSSGQYSIVNVLPGVYDLRVTAEGFKTQTRVDLTITANTVTRTNMRLEVGSLTEQVTVSADVAVLQTDKSETRVELNARQVSTLPLPGYRNYQSLINLVPGATPAVFQNSVTDTPGRSLSTNINGTNRNNNITRIDGAASVNLWLPHHAGYVMPAEMIETVNITTTAGDAEQGFAGGAAITVITKSGTNDFRGSAFEFHDNQRLRARNFFLGPTQQKPVSIYNNFGGTLGGPIKRNKLFFFYSYDNTKQRQGAFGIYSVPTAPLRAGDFSGVSTIIYDPSTGDPNTGAGRQPFAGNRIPDSRISPIAKKVQSYYPQPNISGQEVNNYGIGATPQFNRDYNDVKINFSRNSNHQIWGHYGIMNALVGGKGIFGDGVGPSPGSDPGLGDTRVQNTSVGHNYTISPTVLLDGVFGFQRQDQTVRGADFGKDFRTELGIPGIGGPDPRQQGFPNISINGYNGFGVPNWMPLERIEESFTTSHNLSWLKGAHSFRFGFDGVLHRLNHWQPELGAGPRGAISFTGGTTAPAGASFNNFNGYASFLLGLPYQMQKSLQYILQTGREYQFGWYAQDRWQVTRNFTLNLGLRYEYYPLMVRSHGKGIERLDPETNLVYMGGRGNVPRNNGFTVSKRLFAPRVGFAWRLDDKTVIRSGYGLNYSPLPWSRPLRGFYPLTVNFNFVAPVEALAVRTLAQGIPDVQGPDISSGVVTLPAVADMRSPYAGQITRGYIQSWNFTVERRLPGDLLGTVAYVGTQTTHQLADRDINSGQVIGAGNPGRPYFSRFGRGIATLMWDGYLSSNYHALQSSLRKSFSNGLMLQGAYTWSKAINMADDEGWAGVSWNWEPVFRRNRAPAGYDRTHIFQMGYLYELPMGKGKKWANSGPASYIVGGWSISGVVAAYTGTPFTVTAPGGTLNLPGNTQTADLVSPTVRKLGGVGPGTTWYDTAAFRAPTLAPGERGRFGTTGRNFLRNPGVFNSDLAIARQFDIGERVKLQFRGEAFNFINNRQSTGFASNDVTNPNFLSIRSASNERQMRFGLRLNF
jgi:outer membrane receptor protein involved in Fe transport